MSGPAVHYIIGQLLSSQPSEFDKKMLGEESYFDRTIIRSLQRHSTYLNVGTLGPDFLFFNLKDWHEIADILPLKQMLKVLEVLKSIENTLETSYPILGDVLTLKNDIDEVVADVGETLARESPTFKTIQVLLNDLRMIIELLGATLTAALKDFVTSNVNIFGMLKHPIHIDNEHEKGHTHNDWWWFDILHYSKTGDFAKYLLDHSRQDPKLHAYAIGYLSHVAADTVGHPYVNNIVRGPYRTHGQRHKVVENFQDVSAFHFYYGEEFVQSELHEHFRFNASSINIFSGTTDPELETIIDGLSPDIADIALPADLARLLAEATNAVYQDKNGQPLFGRYLTEEEVDASYRLWYTWFKASTSELLLPDTLPNLPPLTEQFEAVWEKFKQEFSSGLDQVGEAAEELFSGSKFSAKSILNFFKNVGKLVLGLVKAAHAIVTAIEGSILIIPATVVHHMLNYVYQGIYAIYKYFRMGVSLNGFAFPSRNFLSDNKVQHMLNPNMADANNQKVTTYWPYPVRTVDFGGIFRTAAREAHLIYPPPIQEADKAIAAPTSYYQQDHSYYIDKNIAFSHDTMLGLNDPHRIHNAEKMEMLQEEHMGNALVLTAAYYKSASRGNKLPNLNLDADRGMAFPTWTSNAFDSANKRPAEPVQVKLI